MSRWHCAATESGTSCPDNRLGGAAGCCIASAVVHDGAEAVDFSNCSFSKHFVVGLPYRQCNARHTAQSSPPTRTSRSLLHGLIEFMVCVLQHSILQNFRWSNRNSVIRCSAHKVLLPSSAFRIRICVATSIHRIQWPRLHHHPSAHVCASTSLPR